jgi:peptidoglycan hydrolase-like protein with peptidoglycan-binding domain
MQFGANNNGTQVALLQAFLKNSQGFDVNVTGIFDAQTLAAVRAFQTKYLADTMGPWGANQSSGYVYITTTKKINEIACNSPLTLSAADMVIINAYKNAQTGGTVGTNNGGVGPAVPALNASTTPLAPQVGVNTTGGNANTAAVGNTANTASVVNASVLQRMWSWIKGLFGH